MARFPTYTKQDLQKMVSSVDAHCHANQLKSALGRWECQQICHDHFCCFDFGEDDEGGEDGGGGTTRNNYNCQSDERKLCTHLWLRDYSENKCGHFSV